MPLRDVHRALAPPPEGAVFAEGYEFHHFLQDGFDDRGWGCAYRALQTVWSWFRLSPAHAVAAPPPSHRRVQEALVRLGDKPAGFAGSRGWIGSVEIAFALEELGGIASRILPFPCGGELGAAAAALRTHFAGGGPPAMVGGGTAAYLFIGITPPGPGAARVLVLDPHWAGPDDAGAVAAAGYLRWRALAEFGLRGEPYNLLLPCRT